jgi:two-component system, chemotaxis family, protein-glutamate methylesterase/glutaminase
LAVRKPDKIRNEFRDDFKENSLITVVVVDDSAFMRKALSAMLAKDPGIKVVATARNGEEGLEMIRRHDPKVVTLDIEMPVMDGLTTLRHIMMEMPRAVLMISSLTNEGADATLKAMELGALDFIPKQFSQVSLEIVKIEKELQHKVKELARRPVRPAQKGSPRLPVVAHVPLAGKGGHTRDMVAVGVSTGGPPAVQRVLTQLPADFPVPILIAQHMPAAFTGPFAKRLDGLCRITVKEAESGEPLLPGAAYIAPGGKHLKLVRRGTRFQALVTGEPADAIYKPSANELIGSVAEGVGARGLGVMLTGMGSDGLEGVRALKKSGGRAIAQSDATCVVYGMPRAVVEAGLADAVVDIDDMAGAILTSLYS